MIIQSQLTVIAVSSPSPNPCVNLKNSPVSCQVSCFVLQSSLLVLVSCPTLHMEVTSRLSSLSTCLKMTNLFKPFSSCVCLPIFLVSPIMVLTCSIDSVAILLSSPLQLFPAVRIMENGLFSKSGKHNPSVKWQKNVFRACTVIFCSLLSWAGSSELDKFVALIGSFAWYVSNFASWDSRSLTDSNTVSPYVSFTHPCFT